MITRAVSIVRADEAGLCPSSAWYCSCDRHNVLVGVDSQRAARTAARDVESWCEECREESSNDTSVEAVS